MTQWLVFVAIALAFVGSGYLIGRYFLASLLQKPSGGQPVTNPSTNKGTTITAQIQTKPVTFYRVQVGAFSTKENADRVVQAIADKGLGAATMTPDPLYKVFCGVTGTKEAADKLSQSAQAKLAGTVIGKDDKLYVATTALPAKSFSVTGDKTVVEQLQTAFAKSDNVIASLLSFYDSLYLGTQNPVNLSTMASDIAAVRNSLSGLVPPEGLKAAHASALKIASDLAAAVDIAKQAAGGDATKAGPAASAFIKAVDTYMQETKKLSP